MLLILSFSNKKNEKISDRKDQGEETKNKIKLEERSSWCISNTEKWEKINEKGQYKKFIRIIPVKKS